MLREEQMRARVLIVEEDGWQRQKEVTNYTSPSPRLLIMGLERQRRQEGGAK
jgi:hypothetical protein